MPLVKDSETSHILVTGTTGTGKSNCIKLLMPQIRKRGNSAIIVDLTGELVAKYYNKDLGDKIVCPFDNRSVNWDMWQEIGKEDAAFNIEIIAKSLFVQPEHQDPFWNNAAENIFKDCLRYCIEKKEFKMVYLNEMIAKIDLNALASRLKDSYSNSYLEKNNDKTAASIRSCLVSSTDCLRELKDNKENTFNFGDWVDNESSEGRWLFLVAEPKYRDIMKPLISLWLNIIVKRIMNLPIDFDRRLWLIIDELPALKKIPSLPTALAEFRKYGGCIMAGLQSVNQLYSLYGRSEGLTMLDQFNTKVILRTEENDFANYICRSLGEVEYSQASESFSYGAHEMRDGVNFVKQDKKKQLISISDIANLGNLEAYVKLPDPSVRLSKIKMKKAE